MEDKIEQGYLYDFYGELLNEHQQSIYEDFVLNDLSLSEIAAIHNISRQAVYDVIRRCTKTLEDYEHKLHLIDKFMFMKDQVEKLHSVTKEMSQTTMEEAKKEILSISTEILEEL